MSHDQIIVIEPEGSAPDRAGPAEWFARHPIAFRLAIGAAATVSAYAVSRAARRRGRFAPWYRALAALTALQVVGMLRMRSRHRTEPASD